MTTRTAFIALAPLGAILFGALSSFSIYNGMAEIAVLMALSLEEPYVCSLSNWHLVGLLGLPLVGIGMIAMSGPRRWSTRTSRSLFGLATLFFAVTFLAVGFGTWMEFVALQQLASGNYVDPEPFMQQVTFGAIPSSIGWGSLILASAFVFLAGIRMAPVSKSQPVPPRRLAPISFAVAGALVFCLAAVYNTFSYQVLRTVLAKTQADPTRIASGIVGMMVSIFASLVAIGGCALACLAMQYSPLAEPQSATHSAAALPAESSSAGPL